MKRVLSWTILALLAVGGPVRARADEMTHKLWGDVRGRYEGFWFGTDATGHKASDRSRLRYRVRLNGNVMVNSHAGFQMQVGTGGTDPRSGNQTLGSPSDFGPNAFDIRQAFMIVQPYADGKLPDDKGNWTVYFGRTTNPFLWNEGKDLMLWDSDIALAGATTEYKRKFESETKVFANVAYAVVDENSSSKDPFLLAAQLGLKQEMGDRAEGGARVTYYSLDHLDADFVAGGVDGAAVPGGTGGNIADGLTGDVNGGDMQVVEAQGFVGLEAASFTVFGGYSNNTSAKAPASSTIGKQNQAWNVGAQVGNSKRGYGRIGIMYMWLEADAFPSQFVDSDFFDGYTNRKGGMVYYARNVSKGVDFNVQVFSSDVIEANVPVPANSVVNSKRTRGQVDFSFKF